MLERFTREQSRSITLVAPLCDKFLGGLNQLRLSMNISNIRAWYLKQVRLTGLPKPMTTLFRSLCISLPTKNFNSIYFYQIIWVLNLHTLSKLKSSRHINLKYKLKVGAWVARSNELYFEPTWYSFGKMADATDANWMNTEQLF